MDKIEELLSLPGKGGKTFASMQKLDALLGHPHRNFRSIHVGGTNGKGSTSLKIARTLQAASYRVGLYTSPHLFDVRERIQIDQELISRRELEEGFSLIASLMDIKSLSFFDVLTSIAFLYFAKKQVDWAVVEVGLGGSIDPTNVLDPEIAIITSIGWDHAEILGDTLEKIAREKGGIAKPGVPLFVGPSAAPFFPKAKSSPSFPLYDLENRALAKMVLEHLGIPPSCIEVGTSQRPECRFQVEGDWIYDVAHNEQGIERLLQALSVHHPGEKFHFLVGFGKAKEWKACIEKMIPYAKSILPLEVKKDRLVSSREIEGFLAGKVATKRGSGRVVVTGSFYIMAAAREIQRKEGALSLLIHE